MRELGKSIVMDGINWFLNLLCQGKRGINLGNYLNCLGLSEKSSIFLNSIEK